MNILIHACCGNCSAYPFMNLKNEGHDVAGFWFNPNIHPLDEYNNRHESMIKLAATMKVDIISSGDYSPCEFFDAVGISTKIDATDMNNLPPQKERCAACYELRLGKTAEEALKNGFDSFSTTLLISPYQDIERIYAAGKAMSEKFNIDFFFKDFRPFFRESMAHAKKLGIFRQKYCGCVFSMKERNKLCQTALTR